jgi:hypothetical protein
MCLYLRTQLQPESLKYPKQNISFKPEQSKFEKFQSVDFSEYIDPVWRSFGYFEFSTIQSHRRPLTLLKFIVYRAMHTKHGNTRIDLYR